MVARAGEVVPMGGCFRCGVGMVVLYFLSSVVLEVVVSVLTETLLWLIVSATVVAAFGIYWHTFMK